MTKRKPLEGMIAILLAFTLVLTSLVGLFGTPSVAKADSGTGEQQVPALEGKNQTSDSTSQLQPQFKSMDVVNDKTAKAPSPALHDGDSSKDTDGDGLTDLYELNTSFTDPKNVDSDADGKEDGDEVNVHHTDPNVPTPTGINNVPANATKFKYVTAPYRLVELYKNDALLGKATSNEYGIVEIPYNGLTQGDRLTFKIYTNQFTVDNRQHAQVYENPETSPEFQVLGASSVILEATFDIDKWHPSRGDYNDLLCARPGTYRVGARIGGAHCGAYYRIFVYDEHGNRLAETPESAPIRNCGGCKEDHWYYVDVTDAVMDGKITKDQTLLVTVQQRKDRWSPWLPETPLDQAQTTKGMSPLDPPTLVQVLDPTHWNPNEYKQLRVENKDLRATKLVIRVGNLNGLSAMRHISAADAEKNHALKDTVHGFGFRLTHEGGRQGERWVVTGQKPRVRKYGQNGDTQAFQGCIGLHFYAGQFVTVYNVDERTGAFSKPTTIVVPYSKQTPVPEVKFGYDVADPSDPAHNKTLTTINVKPGTNTTEPKKAFVAGDSIRVNLPSYNEEQVYVVGEDVMVSEDGSVNITLCRKLADGDEVVVSATEGYSGESDKKTIIKQDIASPVFDKVFENAKEVKIAPQDSEINDELVVKFPAGSTLKYKKVLNGWQDENGVILTPAEDKKISISVPETENLRYEDRIVAEHLDCVGNRGIGEAIVGRKSTAPTNVEQAYEKINEDDKTPTKIVKGRIPADGFDKTGTTVTLVDESGNPIMHNDAPITGTIGEKVDDPNGDSYYPVIIPIEDENGDKLDDSKKVTIQVQEPEHSASIGEFIALDLTGPDVLESGTEQREFDPIADVTVTINPETPAEKVTAVVGKDKYPLESTEDGKYQGFVPNPNNEPITIIAEDNLGNKTSTEAVATKITDLNIIASQPYDGDISIHLNVEPGSTFVVTIQRNGKEIAKESDTIPADAPSGDIDFLLGERLEKGDKIIISATHGDKVANDLILVVK